MQLIAESSRNSFDLEYCFRVQETEFCAVNNKLNQQIIITEDFRSSSKISMI